MKKERFDTITDAVLAIIITLMVLEIKLPALTAENMRNFLLQIGIYAISFTSIAILWLNHHNMFIGTEKVDPTTIWINFGLLFATSLIPLATRILDESFYDNKSHIFYGSILGITTLLYTLLEERATKHSKEGLRQKTRKMNWSSTIAYLLTIPLSFISIYLSAAIFLLIPVLYFFLPGKLIKLR
jgi:uncharacterized membrane protein